MKVCEKWYPKSEYHNIESDGFYMDLKLKEQIDILLKNLSDDWDFTIVIAGSGEVRVGKSMLAMQIAAYCAYEMKYTYGQNPIFGLNTNFCFEGISLIKKGHILGEKYKYSPLIFDEAGADIDSKKMFNRGTQAVLDYFRECGQYNLINILVLPDYFDLPKGLAITRSVCLIDVTYYPDENDKFKRGYFKFYSRRAKKEMYLKGKKMQDYDVVKPNIKGTFPKFFTVDEKQYRDIKSKALKKRDTVYRDKALLQRNAAFYILNEEMNMTQEEIGRRIEQITSIYTPQKTVGDGIIGVKLREKAPPS